MTFDKNTHVVYEEDCAFTKMKRKRQNDGSSVIAQDTKIKKNIQSFTAHQFKKQLRSENNGEVLQALTLFRTSVGEFEIKSDPEKDIIQAYLKISGECAEIIQLLDGNKRPPKELQLICEVLEKIFLSVIDNHPIYHSSLVRVAHQICQKHIKQVERAIFAGIHNNVAMAGFRLLTSIVMLGISSARNVMSCFSFDHPTLMKLVNRCNLENDEDVRVCYIRFMLSLLVVGDSQLIEDLLSHKDFIKGTFKAVKSDRLSLIQVLLPTLRDKIVMNSAIKKTQKLRLFNEYTLQQLANLYLWDGKNDIDTDKEKDEEERISSGREIVRELIHCFLCDVTCSHRHGINFFDKTYGTSGMNQNSVLFKFLQTLRTATKDSLVEELVVKVLKTCPDILQKYLTSSGYSFFPRASEIWVVNMKFLTKIYKAQPDVPPCLIQSDKVAVHKLVAMAMVTTKPVVISKSTLIQGIKNANLMVCYQSLDVLLLFLERSLKVIQFVQQASPQFSKKEFIDAFTGDIYKELPEVTLLFGIWHRTMNMLSGKQVPDIKEDSLQNPDFSDLLSILLKVLRLYQVCVPSAMEQTTFDFGHLLHDTYNLQEKKLCTDATLQISALRFLETLPRGQIKWFKELKTDKSKQSTVTLLLNLLTSVTDTKLQEASKVLLHKIFRETGIFKSSDQEINIWLQHLLPKQSGSNTKIEIQFLQKILTKVVRNPHPLMDHIAMATVSALQKDDGGGEDCLNDGDGKVLTNQIKDILELDDVPISQVDYFATTPMDTPTPMKTPTVISNETVALQLQTTDTASTEMLLSPFSALVPAALQEWIAFTKLQQASITFYLTSVLRAILHSQDNPVPMCMLVSEIMKDCKADDTEFEEFVNYCSFWLPGSSKKKNFKKAKQNTMSSQGNALEVLYKTFLLHHEELTYSHFVLKTAALICKKPLNNDQMKSLIQQLMLYARTSILQPQKFELPSQVLRNCLQLVLKTLKQCQSQHSEHKESFDQTLTTDEETTLCEGQSSFLLELTKIVFTSNTFTVWLQNIEGSTTNSKHGTCPIICLFLKDAVKQLKQSVSNELLKGWTSNVFCTLVDKASDMTVNDLLDFNSLTELFQAVQNLLEVDNFKDFLQNTALLPTKSLLNSDKDGLSDKGRFFILLTQLSTGLDQSGRKKQIDKSVAKKLLSLFEATDDEKADSLICHMIRQNTGVTDVATKKTLLRCLEGNKQKVLTAAYLVERRDDLCSECLDWLKKKKSKEMLNKHQALFIPVINVLLTKESTGIDSLTNLFWDWLAHWCITESSDQLSASFLPELSNRIEECDDDGLLRVTVLKKLAKTMDEEVVIGFVEQLCKRPIISKIPFNRLQLVACSGLIDQITSQSSNVMCEFLHSCLHSIIILTKESSNEAYIHHYSNVILQSIQDFDADIGLTLAFVKTWNKFVKDVLKSHYQTSETHSLLSSLLVGVYSKSQSLVEGIIPASTIFQMVVSHSAFIPTMLLEVGADQDIDSLKKVKESLVKLISTLLDLDCSACTPSHFAVFLGAYGATMQPVDQQLLYIMYLCEIKQVDVWSFRPFMFGKIAVEQHMARSSLGRSLWTQPSMAEVIALFDAEKLKYSYLNFPLERKLQPMGAKAQEEDCNLTKEPETETDSIDTSRIYDPCCVLPMFSYLMSPTSLVDCSKLIESGCIDYIFAALGSQDSAMRAAAYHCLSEFYTHLETARFWGRREVAYVLDCLRNSIKKPNQRIPNVMCMMLGRVLHLILTPDDPMYKVVFKMLFVKPELNLETVPMTQRLFYSSNLQNKSERAWLLQLMIDGLRDKHDFYIYNQQSHVFKTLLSFFNTYVCDRKIQGMIIQLLEKVTMLPEATLKLIQTHSLLSWIEGQVMTSSLNEELLARLGNLTELLVKSASLSMKSLADEEAGQILNQCYAVHSMMKKFQVK
ncbi:nucleolar pre-ribosomal-associated protein 1-like [Antedon mediterranea]|uniref:nucleolar pre-ribosomal-associated protein 1-like n=1 Tax=Antedon mediterranea TaxID=105859 RepID=UPI003AF72784